MPGQPSRPRDHRPQYADDERVGTDPRAAQAAGADRTSDRVPHHRVQRRREAGSQERRRDRLDHQTLQTGAAALGGLQARTVMSSIDPTEVFRQEAAELFETLEAALLDLCQRPDDRELVDQAFRALHTIKGSGAMFGFDKVAAFTHEFETAFERVRKGEIKPTQELISVALAAKDYIRALIEAPDSTDSIIGDAILDDLRQFVALPGVPAAGAAEEAPAPKPAAQAHVGWRLYLEFDSHIL